MPGHLRRRHGRRGVSRGGRWPQSSSPAPPPSGPALRPLRGARWRSSRRRARARCEALEGRCRNGGARGGHGRSSSQAATSRAMAGRWGLRRDQHAGAPEPGAAPREVEPESLPPGTSSSSGGSPGQKAFGVAFDAVAPRAGRTARRGRGRADRSRWSGLPAPSRPTGSSSAASLPRDEALRDVAGATAALFSSALGEPAPRGRRGAGGRGAGRRDGRRWRPRGRARRRERPPGAAGRPQSSRPLCGACSRSPGCVSALPRRRAVGRGTLERARSTGSSRPCSRRPAADERPRVLFVGAPLPPPAAAWLAKKWDAVERCSTTRPRRRDAQGRSDDPLPPRGRRSRGG